MNLSNGYGKKFISEEKMMNNYEKIKSMSIDEMLEWFTDVDDAPECLGCKMCIYCAKIKRSNGSFQFIQCCDEKYRCKEGIREWLQQEGD